MSSAALKKQSVNQQVPATFNTLLEKLHDIPTLPIVAIQVNELINNPKSSSKDIAEVLKKDQVLTAKVLKLINSPYYGIPGGVTDVKRALAFLGFNTLAQLVLGMSVFSLFKAEENEHFSLIGFWKHALGTAVSSEVIAKHIKFNKPEECFTCGLLHDIGKIVLYQLNKEMLFQIVQKAKAEQKSYSMVETELNFPTHTFLGEHIAQKWGLPQIIRSVIRYHHQDVREMRTILSSEKIPIQIVALSNALMIQNKNGNSGDYSDGSLKPAMWEALGLTEKDLEEIKKKTDVELKKAVSFLAVYGG